MSTEVKESTPKTGVVKWFDANRGFGYIEPDEGGNDLFVHFTGILMDGYKTLETGERVEYLLGKNDRGPIAVSVSRK